MKTSRWYAIFLVGFMAVLFTACPPTPKHTVSFDTDGGTEISDQLIKEGDTVTKPVDPAKQDYTFEGWFLDDAAYDFATPVTASITLKAKWKAVEKEPEPEPVTYNVIFDSNGGTKVESVTVNEGETVTEPKAPTRDGYTFNGWYLGKTKYDFSKAVTSDLKLKASWTLVENNDSDEKNEPSKPSTPVEYTVTFNSNGGTEVDAKKVTKNSKVEAPVVPSKTGYNFTGWYLNDAEYDFNSPVVSDITLTAKWTVISYTVTFKTAKDEITIEVDYKNCVNEPEKPENGDLIFAGWYLDDNKYDFATPVTADMTLLAKWTSNPQYTVTVFDGETEKRKDTVTEFENYMYNEPILIKEGYTLKSITTDDGGKNKVTFPLAIDMDTKLYAWFEINTYTVGFDVDGISSQTVEHGKKATKPVDPTKEGFIFEGWYLNGAEYDFNIPVTTDITLTAKWRTVENDPDPVIYTVIFDSNGGSEIPPCSVYEGECVLMPTDPVREEYYFVGWYLDDNVYYFNTPVTANITLLAKWALPPQYTVTIFDGETELRNETVTNSEDYMYTPSSITKDGYTLKSITSDKFGVHEVTFPLAIAMDTKLYAWFEINTYTVGFDVDGISSQTVEHGKKATKPVDPTKEGFIFEGWYLNGAEYDFNIPVTADITLTAKWIEAKYDINGINVTFGLKDVDVTVTDDDSVKVLTASDGYTSYSWKIGDVEVGTKKIFRFDTEGKLPGQYQIDLIAMKNTMPYFTQVKITILEESNE